MEPLKAKEIINAVQGNLISGDSEKLISGISTDSRTTVPGDFFIPIKGETHDGTEFIRPAIGRGAVGCFIPPGYSLEGLQYRKEIAIIEVPDCKYAMGQFAHYYMNRYKPRIIAVTGSNGKTSTKEMIASILQSHISILKNEGSFNNDIGLPLTLFKLNRHHKVLVIEMGMNHAGEIHRLTEICSPDIGVITNISEAHIEFLGSLENIAEAKYELLEKMTEANIAILNADDGLVTGMGERTRAIKVRFGITSPNTDFSATDIQYQDDSSGIQFQLHTPAETLLVHLPVLGLHQISNALAAAAAAWQIIPNAYAIQKGLEQFKPAKMRMQVIPANGFVLINDAYNANPKSTAAALKTLQDIPSKGRKIVVLGDMRELGEHAINAHRDIGKQAVSAGVSMLVTVGDHAKEIAQGALNSGFPAKQIIICANRDEAADNLSQIILPGDLILLKASRKMEFEKLTQVLLNLPINHKPGKGN